TLAVIIYQAVRFAFLKARKRSFVFKSRFYLIPNIQNNGIAFFAQRNQLFPTARGVRLMSFLGGFIFLEYFVMHLYLCNCRIVYRETSVSHPFIFAVDNTFTPMQ